ncbi:MAG TPA: heme-dependent oxidative N-demethylase subunit alpha family protein [Miltoncostaea sp.]|nr:heme-dependent oxidative N-demethylase subunit alpha family protein [Miltoncostaea sp.]
MTLPVLPVGDRHSPRSLGLRPLGDAPLTIRDPEPLPGELALRRRLLDEDRDARFAALPGTRDAQAAALRLIAGDVRRQGAALDPPDGLADPIDWAGRQVAEDLLLLDAARPDVPLVAGSLCFPNGWEIRTALGRPVLAIHAPVPGFAATISGPTLALMRRLRAGRPVWRANWTLRTTDRLDLPPGVPLPPPPADAGRIWVRVERQTLSRVPGAESVLFTVHTRSRTVAEVCADPVRARRLHRALTVMGPEMRAYKGLDALAGPVLAWLERRAHAS